LVGVEEEAEVDHPVLAEIVVEDLPEPGGEEEEEAGSAGAVPGFALAEQHVMGLVEDHCDRGEAPG